MLKIPHLRLSVLDQSPISSGSTAARALEDSIRLARHCEALGYDRFWMAEHHGTERFACVAPELMLARLGAEVKRMRIGTGALLLPHYAPLKVAESFRMLEALYPGRIDLGIGRAQGGGEAETEALRLDAVEGSFTARLRSLIALLGLAGSESADAYPSVPGAPELWLLGSSPASAVAAAELGLPYTFAHFLAPAQAEISSTLFYRTHFHRTHSASSPEKRPRTMAAVAVVCAETESEAKRLSQTIHALWRRNRHGDRRAVPSPEEAALELRLDPEPPADPGRLIAGTPEQVKDQLDKLARACEVEELMIHTIAHDPEARRRSYSLVAEAFGLSAG